VSRVGCGLDGDDRGDQRRFVAQVGEPAGPARDPRVDRVLVDQGVAFGGDAQLHGVVPGGRDVHEGDPLPGRGGDLEQLG